MPPRKSVLQLANEAAKKDKGEAAKKRAEEKKAEEAAKAEKFRKIKEERVEKTKITSLPPTQQQPPLKKPREEVPQPQVPLKPQTEQKGAPSAQPTPTEAQSSKLPPPSFPPPPPAPLEVAFPRNPVIDAPPFVPKILIPSLEHPTGRPFTIQDTALNHPEEYLKGVLPPRDRVNAQKTKPEDLPTTLMKSLLATTFNAMEMIAREEAARKKIFLDDGEVKRFKDEARGLKKVIEGLEKGKEELESSNKALKGKNLELEQKIKSAESLAAARGDKVSSLEKSLTSKDEIILKKNEEHNAIKAELSTTHDDNKKLSKLVESLLAEQKNKEEALQKVREDAAAELQSRLDAQLQELVVEVKEARNVYFLDGWEAAMQKAGIDQSTAMYREVPFPNPQCSIPEFSFNRPPPTPSLQTLEEDIIDVGEEVESAPKDLPQQTQKEDPKKGEDASKTKEK